MKSTIFFRYFTNLDCAFIDDEGMICGHSQLLSCYMTGEPTEEESVVLDFSKGKKQLKAIIDDVDTGLDHKLLVFKFSKYEKTILDDGRIKITTPYLEMELPVDAVNFIDDFGYISTLVNDEMKKLYPNFNLECKIESSLQGYTNGFAKYFRYSHGLKDSTSYGCKNMGHGHLSFVEVLTNIDDVEIYNTVIAESIADHLNNAVFINEKNIIEKTKDHITIQYETCERGLMKATYKQPHKLIVLKTETTIEYIIEYVRKKFAKQLKGKTLRISEGLQKGAQINV